MPSESRERRRTPRRPAGDKTGGPTHVRLRARGPVDVIDISGHGVLLEGLSRLPPGVSLDVDLTIGCRPARVRAHVVRCHVARLVSDRVIYRSALAFDTVVELPAETGTRFP